MNVYRVTGMGREEHVQVVEQVQDEVSRTTGRDRYVPENVEQVWVEEFGGGAWVRYPVRSTPRSVLQRVLYGPAYQGPGTTRQGRGIWQQFRGPGT